ncbi:MAG: DUF2946 family protein [Hydrogenophaga sp.]|uniref:DUF2946 family protein n=1 Tax=Hydrogenophaga sp. TaxID=1904254 RepID=UPI0027157D23|nr:DUF2946 family protein [Hydrogenophaga sp.]MDO9571692.1 DUF2946 family protein [Hydrogenophaga sp.]
MSTHLKRSLTRVLLAAMLLAVLAPGLSRVLASTRVAGDWVEVCSAQGMQWVQLADRGALPQPGHAGDLQHALDHCGHCALAAERFAPLQPSLPAVPAGDGVWASPAYLAAARHVLNAPSPGARGPPLLS